MPWISTDKQAIALMHKVPGIAEPFEALYASFWTQTHLPAQSLELCRLRLALLLRSELDFERTDFTIAKELRSNLVNWVGNPLYSAAEQACLEFTEVYAMDAQAVTDELAAAVTHHHGDAGLVTLVEALGVFNGLARMTLLWQLEESNGDQSTG